MGLTVERALVASRKLARRGKLTGAETTLRRALRRFPRNRRLRSALETFEGTIPAALSVEQMIERGDAWWRDGRSDRARPFYEAALTRAPENVVAEMRLALTDRSEGRTQDALKRYTRLIAQAPDFAEPYRYVSDMRRTEPGDGWIETLAAALEVATEDSARAALSFALGKALADVGAHDAAFTAYEIANRLRRATLGDRPLNRIRTLLTVTEAFSAPEPGPEPGPEPLAGLTPWPDAPRPIFIIGLPRTGTTLVERILAQHSAVMAGGERSDLTDALSEAGGTLGWPDARQAKVIRDTYLSLLPDAPQGVRWITDKMPSNARWVGVIRRVLPEALIIETKRDLVAAGWSLYSRDFTSEELAYSFDLTEIAGYFTAHQDMMAQWHQKWHGQWHGQAPGQIRSVDYERLSAAPGDEIPALLNDLGLSFEPACLAPEQHESSVHTASFEQVRRPIYQGSSDGWQPYAARLGPLVGLGAP